MASFRGPYEGFVVYTHLTDSRGVAVEGSEQLHAHIRRADEKSPGQTHGNKAREIADMHGARRANSTLRASRCVAEVLAYDGRAASLVGYSREFKRQRG